MPPSARSGGSGLCLLSVVYSGLCGMTCFDVHPIARWSILLISEIIVIIAWRSYPGEKSRWSCIVLSVPVIEALAQGYFPISESLFFTKLLFLQALACAVLFVIIRRGSGHSMNESKNIREGQL